jgi:hypothetical protein
MPLFTVSEIILIAKKSQFLASNDIQRKGYFGGGIDLQLPRKIKAVRENVEWMYNLDPTDDTLVGTANYLLSLCGAYSFKANAISGGGTVSPIAPPSTLNPYQFTVDGSSFIATGEDTKNITLFIGYNIIFVRNNIPQSSVDNGGTYFTWDKVTGEFTCVGAAGAGELFQIYPI